MSPGILHREPSASAIADANRRPRCRHCQRFLGYDRHGRRPEIRTYCDRRCQNLDRLGKPTKNYLAGLAALVARRRAFDRVVLDHVTLHDPKPIPRIHSEVVDDWGPVTARSTYRAIARLRDRRRLIQRVPEGYVRTRRAAE